MLKHGFLIKLKLRYISLRKNDMAIDISIKKSKIDPAFLKKADEFAKMFSVTAKSSDDDLKVTGEFDDVNHFFIAMFDMDSRKAKSEIENALSAKDSKTYIVKAVSSNDAISKVKEKEASKNAKDAWQIVKDLISSCKDIHVIDAMKVIDAIIEK